MISDEDIQFADELMKDYLLYRGFTATYKIFIEERKLDKTQGQRTTKIVVRKKSILKLCNIEIK